MTIIEYEHCTSGFGGSTAKDRRIKQLETELLKQKGVIEWLAKTADPKTEQMMGMEDNLRKYLEWLVKTADLKTEQMVGAEEDLKKKLHDVSTAKEELQERLVELEAQNEELKRGKLDLSPAFRSIQKNIKEVLLLRDEEIAARRDREDRTTSKRDNDGTACGCRFHVQQCVTHAEGGCGCEWHGIIIGCESHQPEFAAKYPMMSLPQDFGELSSFQHPDGAEEGEGGLGSEQG